MPRIYTSQSIPLDFCHDCFPSEAAAEIDYGNLGSPGDERETGYGYESEHPAYEETEYTCEECDCELTDKDD